MLLKPIYLTTPIHERPLAEASLIFTHDGNLYLDTATKRIPISDIVFAASLSDLQSVQKYVNKIYCVDSVLYLWNGTSLVSLTVQLGIGAVNDIVVANALGNLQRSGVILESTVELTQTVSPMATASHEKVATEKGVRSAIEDSASSSNKQDKITSIGTTANSHLLLAPTTAGGQPGKVPVADFATAVQGAKAENAVQPGDLHTVATTGSYADLGNRPALGTVAALNTGTASGNIPVLGADGKLNTAVLPALAVTDTFPVASQSAMLALTVEKGDVAVRTDLNKTFILKAEPASTLANWQELLSPTSPVQSVNAKTGAVTLTASDVGAIPMAEKGTASGVATLGTDTKVPIAQLPTQSSVSNSATAIPTGAAVYSHTNATSAHSATDAATASRIVMRDASGRAKFAAPDAETDAANKKYVDDKFGSAVFSFGSPTGTVGQATAANNTNNEGTETTVSRSDHRHELYFDSTAPAVTGSSTGTAGTSTIPARRDHRHGFTSATDAQITSTGTANSAGNGSYLARGNHQHAIGYDSSAATNLPASLGTADPGISTYPSRQDHVHAKPTATELGVIAGNLADILSGSCSTAVGTAAKTTAVTGFTLETGRLVAVTFTNGNSSTSATLNVTSTGAYGIRMLNRSTVPVLNNIPASHIAYLYFDGLYWLLLNPANLATATPAALGTAAVGTSNLAARSDHVHASPAIPAGANLGVTTASFGQAIAHGSATTFARSDHSHPLPAAPTSVSGNAGDIASFNITAANRGTSLAPATTAINQAGSAHILTLYQNITWLNANKAAADHTHSSQEQPTGTCSTAVGTAAKTLSITGFTRSVGSTVTVTFTNGNSSASATLNVTSTGAAGIRTLDRTTVPVLVSIPAGHVADLRFDGTYWLLLNPANGFIPASAVDLTAFTNTVTSTSPVTTTASRTAQSHINLLFGQIRWLNDNKGTSSLTIGTGSSNAAAGNHTHAWSSITSSPTIPSAANLSGQAATAGQSANNGVAATFARSDHYHALPASAGSVANLSGQPTASFGQSVSTGSATTAARSDHYHAFPAAPTTVTGNAGNIQSFTPTVTAVQPVTSASSGTGTTHIQNLYCYCRWLNENKGSGGGVDLVTSGSTSTTYVAALTSSGTTGTSTTVARANHSHPFSGAVLPTTSHTGSNASTNSNGIKLWTGSASALPSTRNSDTLYFVT